MLEELFKSKIRTISLEDESWNKLKAIAKKKFGTASRQISPTIRLLIEMWEKQQEDKTKNG